ncbi:MAG: TetR/AcrR family transcriptional regulator [Bacteroidales bacterium]|jgi:AcrR family transcriptional regulator|nr:TetR/AcrR family transcriptional regulator [Bacteroidales bacterium]
MEKQKQTTEEQILEAAEKVFLEKGFNNTKISDIAKSAGANNALINYYFRSKENLFNKVLTNKIEFLANAMEYVLDQDLSFEDMIKHFSEAQFDFFKENEALLRFIFNEILPNESRINMFRQNIIPVVLQASAQLDKRLQEEITAGRVRNIKMFDLLYTMISLNILCFVIRPIIMGTGEDENSITEHFSQVMENRKEKNVEIIMSYLKI